MERFQQDIIKKKKEKRNTQSGTERKSNFPAKRGARRCRPEGAGSHQKYIKSCYWLNGSTAQEIRSEEINKKSDKDGAYPEGGEGFPRVKIAGY